VVAPKRGKLRQAEQQLDTANAALAAKQAVLREVVKRVDGLRQQLAKTQAEQRRLNEQVGGLVASNSCKSLLWICELVASKKQHRGLRPRSPGGLDAQTPRARKQAHIRPR
jgi:septal ring factor EnvC (AmiA/AmiB activator)